MRKNKKIVALFLSVLLILSLIQIPVFAANYNASQIVLSVEQLVGLKNKTNSDLRWVEQQFSQHYGIELEGENCCVSHVAEYMIDSTSDKKIPLGAVVFFEETFIYDKEDNEPVNHIGIHIGDNYIVHAFDWDSQGTVISKDKISSLIRSERYNFKGWGWFSDVELEDDTFEFTIKNPDTYPKFPGTIESFKNSNYPTASYYVLFVQEGLQALDFDVINNGIFDSSTIQAVKAFQSQNNLKANGVIDNDTWGTLCSLLNKKFGKDIEPDIPDKEPIREPIKVNFDIKNSDTYPKMRYDEYYFTDKNDLMSGQDVAFIQAGLQDLGFDALVNGYYDYSTEKVVSVFQKQNYLKGNGVVDRDTWGTIVSLLEKKYQKDIAPDIPEKEPEREPIKVTFDIKNPDTYPKMRYDKYYYTENDNELMKGQDVAFIQEGLFDLGYDAIVDGYYDYSTEKVVSVFQRQNYLKGNGVVDRDTWGTIVSLLEKKYQKDIIPDIPDKEPEKLQINFKIKKPSTYPKMTKDFYAYYKEQIMFGEDVAFIQAGLQDLGYDVVINGYFDYSTEKVVMLFQEKNNLKSNGIVYSNTWNKIVSKLEKKYGDNDSSSEGSGGSGGGNNKEDYDKLIINFNIKNPDTYPKMRYDEYYFTDKNDLMSGQDVAFIQAGLQDLGFDVAINGYFDYSTAKVVSVFQRQNYLKGNGVVDRDTWGTIVSLLEKKYQKDIAPEVNVKFDIKNPNTYPKMVRDYYTYYKEQTLFGEDIAFIQTGLQDLGYDVVINGYYDYSTAKVVQVFQEQHNMKSNGVFEQETWKVLVALLEEKYEKDITFDKELPIPDIDNPFKDVQYKDYFYAPVLWAYDNEITKGMSDIDFVPYGNCTRGQAVTFLWRAAGSPEPQTVNNLFVDISPEDYFYKAVLWAIENGITAGTGGDYFSPNIKCSNAHILTFLWRTMGKPYETDTDIWYEDAVNWANKTDLIKGTDLNDFDPNSDAFRANIVTYLYKYFEGADIK